METLKDARKKATKLKLEFTDETTFEELEQAINIEEENIKRLTEEAKELQIKVPKGSTSAEIDALIQKKVAELSGGDQNESGEGEEEIATEVTEETVVSEEEPAVVEEPKEEIIIPEEPFVEPAMPVHMRATARKSR